MNRLFQLFPSFFNKPAVAKGEGDALSQTTYSTAPSSFGAVLQKWNQKSIWIVPLLLIFLMLVMTVGVQFVLFHMIQSKNTALLNQNTKTTHILNTVEDMDAQLQLLSINPKNTGDFNTALKNIHADLSELQQSVSTHSGMTKVSTQLSSMQEDMDTQMDGLRKTVAGGEKSYLDPQVLPFKVISIDVIAQQPFVTVEYDHHQTPLEMGDSLAAWKVTDADYESSSVEFENAKNQYVKVNLQGTGA